MFTPCPHARFGEQAVHIKSLSDWRFEVCCGQFIERTKRAVAINRLKLFVSGIIPGNWGKAGPGWLAGLLQNRAERCGGGGRIHQFLWHVRTCQMRMRDLAARSDQKLLRTESSSSGRFRAWANRSYPEGIRLQLCISTVRATLAVRRKPEPPGKAAERRTK